MTSSTRLLETTSAAVTIRVVHGLALERRPHPRGTVLTVAPGQIVVYCLRARSCRTFVFRTLERPEAYSSELPGVSPAVRLLLQTQTVGRLARLEDLVHYLAKTGRDPSALSDVFYSRLNAILAGKLPRSRRSLRSLFEREACRSHVA